MSKKSYFDNSKAVDLYKKYCRTSNSVYINEISELAVPMVTELGGYISMRLGIPLQDIEDAVSECNIAILKYLNSGKYEVARGTLHTVLYDLIVCTVKNFAHAYFRENRRLISTYSFTKDDLKNMGVVTTRSIIKANDDIHNEVCDNIVSEKVKKLLNNMKIRFQGVDYQFCRSLIKLITDKYIKLFYNRGEILPKEYFDAINDYQLDKDRASFLRDYVIVKVRWTLVQSGIYKELIESRKL